MWFKGPPKHICNIPDHRRFLCNIISNLIEFIIWHFYSSFLYVWHLIKVSTKQLLALLLLLFLSGVSRFFCVFGNQPCISYFLSTFNAALAAKESDPPCRYSPALCCLCCCQKFHILFLILSHNTTIFIIFI